MEAKWNWSSSGQMSKCPQMEAKVSPLAEVFGEELKVTHWIVSVMRGYGQSQASSRRIPGGDARRGVQGSLPGDEMTQM